MIKFITHTTFCFFLVHIVLSAVFLLPPNFTWPAVCALVCSTIFSVLQFEAKHVHLFHHDLFYVKLNVLLWSFLCSCSLVAFLSTEVCDIKVNNQCFFS